MAFCPRLSAIGAAMCGAARYVSAGEGIPGSPRGDPGMAGAVETEVLRRDFCGTGFFAAPPGDYLASPPLPGTVYRRTMSAEATPGRWPTAIDVASLRTCPVDGLTPALLGPAVVHALSSGEISRDAVLAAADSGLAANPFLTEALDRLAVAPAPFLSDYRFPSEAAFREFARVLAHLHAHFSLSSYVSSRSFARNLAAADLLPCPVIHVDCDAADLRDPSWRAGLVGEIGRRLSEGGAG